MNKRCILATILILLLLVVGTTVYKVVTRHNQHLMEVSSKYIEEQAEKCFNEKKCTGFLVSLENLYTYGYLERQVNPVTKEYYNPGSYIEKEDSLYTFVIKD